MKVIANYSKISREALIEEISKLSNDLLNLRRQHRKTKIEGATIKKQLCERKKELRAEHLLSSIINNKDLLLPEMLKEIVSIIPKSWQFPIKTSARITLNGVEYRTDNFKISDWKLSESIFVNNSFRGSIEVYLEEGRFKPINPFLKEEVALLKVFAERIGNVVQRFNFSAQEKEQLMLNQLLTETIPFGMDIIDSSGTILFANQNIKKIFGQDIVGRTCWKIYRTDQEQCNLCPLKEGINIGKTKICESAGIIGDRVFEIFHTGFLLNGEKAILEIFNDVTTQKQREEENNSNKILLQNIIDNLQDGYFRTDADGNLTFINPEGLSMYGYTNEELLGRPSKILYANEKERDGLIKSLFHSGKISDYSIQGKKKDGTTIWVSMNVQWIFDKDGNVIGTEGVVRDISERIRLENEIEESRKKFELMLESISVGIFLTSEHHVKIDYINSHFTQMLGYDISDVPTIARWLELAYPDEAYRNEVATDLTTQVMKASVDDSFKILMESKVTCKDGSSKQIIWSGYMLGPQLLGCGIDVTSARKYELDLIAAKEKAQESDRLKTSFLLNMSHEIRTPINGIFGFMSLLNQPDLNNIEKSDYINIIRQSGERLMNTMDDIIEISKIEAGDILVQYEDVDLSEFMLVQYTYLSDKATEKGLKSKFSSNLTLRIRTDKNKLGVIIKNILKNAIKFTEQGEIELGGYLQDGFACIYVSDTGRGISADKIESIFNRFVQSDTSLSRGYEGSGIGLSVVKAYVEALNGKIEVVSEIGKGSKFIIYIPIIQD